MDDLNEVCKSIKRSSWAQWSNKSLTEVTNMSQGLGRITLAGRRDVATRSKKKDFVVVMAKRLRF